MSKYIYIIESYSGNSPIEFQRVILFADSIDDAYCKGVRFFHNQEPYLLQLVTDWNDYVIPLEFLD